MNMTYFLLDIEKTQSNGLPETNSSLWRITGARSCSWPGICFLSLSGSLLLIHSELQFCSWPQAAASMRLSQNKPLLRVLHTLYRSVLL